MNILDEKFAEFQNLSTEQKIECFKKNGRLFDMIISQQLNREIIDDIDEITNYLRHISKSKAGSLFMQKTLCHKRAMLYFSQRTNSHPFHRPFREITILVRIFLLPGKLASFFLAR
jgi:hypothetical protein